MPAVVVVVTMLVLVVVVAMLVLCARVCAGCSSWKKLSCEPLCPVLSIIYWNIFILPQRPRLVQPTTRDDTIK